MTIRWKLMLSFFLLLVLVGAQFAISMYFQTKETVLINTLLQNHNLSNELSKLAGDGQKIRRFEKEYFIYLLNDEKRQGYWVEWNEARESIANYLQSINGIMRTMNLPDQAAEISDWRAALVEVLSRILSRPIRQFSGERTNSEFC